MLADKKPRCTVRRTDRPMTRQTVCTPPRYGGDSGIKVELTESHIGRTDKIIVASSGNARRIPSVHNGGGDGPVCVGTTARGGGLEHSQCRDSETRAPAHARTHQRTDRTARVSPGMRFGGGERARPQYPPPIRPRWWFVCGARTSKQRVACVCVCVVRRPRRVRARVSAVRVWST